MPLAVLCRDCINYKKGPGGFTSPRDSDLHWCSILLRHFYDDFGCIRGVSKTPSFALEIEIPPTDPDGSCNDNCPLIPKNCKYRVYKCLQHGTLDPIPDSGCIHFQKEKSND
jgi:hypothetical protein